MTYAMITDNVVRNIVSLHPRNAAAFPDAVLTNDLPVSIGDSYVDGVFYHEGVEVTLPSYADEDTEDMQNALSMLEVRVNG